jgi:EEF1A lysine methyltransferase 4
MESLTSDLYNIGYKNQCSIDFSHTAIEVMKEKHKNIASLEWKVMDVRNMDLGNEKFDIAIDKVHFGRAAPPAFV